MRSQRVRNTTIWGGALRTVATRHAGEHGSKHATKHAGKQGCRQAGRQAGKAAHWSKEEAVDCDDKAEAAKAGRHPGCAQPHPVLELQTGSS